MAPKGLANKLAALSGDVGRADARPTRQARAVFEDLSARLAARVRQLDEVIANEVAPLSGVKTTDPKRE